MRAAVPFLVAFMATSTLAQPSPTPAKPSPLAAFEFLVGQWDAEGGGQPGASAGRFSFEWAADRHALVRRNESTTATGRHSDVMLVGASPEGAVRALYVDSEGHAIDYAVSVVPETGRVVFESSGAGPRFRLWYQPAKDGTLATGFQIAPPGASEFKTYLEGVARRR